MDRMTEEKTDVVLGQPADLNEGPKPFRFVIESAVLKSILGFAAKGDIRYYLNAVLVEVTPAGDVVLVATDGHCLLAHRVIGEVENAVPGTLTIIARELLDRAKPAKGSKTVTVEILGSKITVIGELTSSADAVEATFVNWRRVIPTEFTGATAQINPRFFAKVAAHADSVLGKTASPECFSNGVGKPVLFTFGSGALAVLMPLRVEPKFEGLPAWCAQ